MSENLSIKINSLHENGFDLKDCSCVFILGSTILNAHIPTKADIFINTTKIADEEILSLIVKHNGQNIVKSFIPVGAVRRDKNYKYKLQPLGVKAEIGSIFTLDMEFSVTIDGQEVGSENKADNPFQQNLYKSETGFTTQDFYASVRPDDLLKNEVERERIINEVRLDRFGVVPIETQSIPYFSPPATSPNTMKAIVSTLEAIEVKPATGGIELRNQADVNNLIQDLKTSVELLEKRIEHKVTEVEDIETGAVEYVEKNFAQSAPIYSTEDFNDREREHHSGNNSPEFGKKEFNRTVPGEINIHEAESYHPIHTLKVPESRGSHVNKWEDHNSDAYLQSGILKGERRNSRQYTETARSAYDDVKIEKNETYMLSMKNQLSSKHISFINDAFTRDIILYMAQSKKKISAVRLRRSITLGPKEEADIDKKEFFNSNCTTKFVHFFQSLSRNLYLYNLVQPFDHIDDTAMKVELNIPFDISPFHKSAITPAGHIFIAGAEADNSNSLQPRGSNTFHVYNYKNRRLLEKPSMLCQSREEFGFCYMSKNLFAIGGVVDGVISNKCERFDVRANKWIKIAPMTRPLREVAVCSFNNRYLYRFFGIDSGNNIDHSIERYDAVRDTWTIMNVSINETAKEIYTPFCTQVNQDCIFLFGGKNINGFAPKTCKGWVLKVEDKRGSNNGALVESKNFIPGLAGTFNGNSVLTHSGDILFLRESY